MPHLNRTGGKCQPSVEPNHSPAVVVVHSPAPSGKIMLTINEFKAWYGFGHTKTYELLKDQKIKAVSAGSRTLIYRDSADAYIASLPPYQPERRAA